MSNDPLEAVFVTGDEAAALKRADTARKLATYLERMPVELRGLFAAEFQRVKQEDVMSKYDNALDSVLGYFCIQVDHAEGDAARAELAQLRTDLKAEKWRVDTLSSARNVLAAQLQAAQDRIAQQAAQLSAAYETAAKVAENCALRGAGTDRRYKVAMDIARQLREIAANAQPQEQSRESIQSSLDWFNNESGF